MSNAVVFQEFVNDGCFGNGALGARVVSPPAGITMLLISRINYGNDSTFSINLQSVQEIEVLERALAAAKLALQK